MKINESTAAITSSAGSQEATSAAQNARVVRPSQGGSGSSDQLELSKLGKSLSLQQLDSAQHASRVAELRAAVAGDRYRVDAQQVSRKLIEEHLSA
jgi:flagellar biosynthesis anti-sigma factor FlgM